MPTISAKSALRPITRVRQGTSPAARSRKNFSAQPFTAWTFYRWSAPAAHAVPRKHGRLQCARLVGAAVRRQFQVRPENVESVKSSSRSFSARAILPPRFGRLRPDELRGLPVRASAAARPATPTACSSSIRKRRRPKSPMASQDRARVGEPAGAAAAGFTIRRPNTSSRSRRRSPIRSANATTQWNVSDPRGFAWVNGEFRCGLYNHYSRRIAQRPIAWASNSAAA